LRGAGVVAFERKKMSRAPSGFIAGSIPKQVLRNTPPRLLAAFSKILHLFGHDPGQNAINSCPRSIIFILFEVL
jgi:hypothetical protein